MKEQCGFSEEQLSEARDMVYGFALRLTQGNRAAADDITQETLIRAWRSREKFDQNRKLKPWLFTICRRLFLNWERDSERHRRAVEESWEGFSIPIPKLICYKDGDGYEMSSALKAPDEEEKRFGTSMNADQILNNLAAALEKVSPEFAEVFMLHHVHGLSHEKTAKYLGIPTGTVKSRLFRCREFVEEELKEQVCVS